LKSKRLNKGDGSIFSGMHVFLKNRTVPIYFICLLSITVFAMPILAAKAAEETKEEKISLDLKNIEVL